MGVFGRGATDTLLIDARHGSTTSAADVDREADRWRGSTLAFLFADQTTVSARRFLGLLHAEVPFVLLDPRTAAAGLTDLERRYRPDLLLFPPGAGSAAGRESDDEGVWRDPDPDPRPIHGELAVLLGTSGSTGSPKFVRLSRGGLVSNAHAIAQSVGLTRADRGVTSLPLFYSFGMSILTSHIAAGASVLVSDRSAMQPDFLPDLDRFAVTHLAGVPLTFAMLDRLRFTERHLPNLRALMQAGGRLAPTVVERYHADCTAKGREFFVMYGQTEAGPRMACLPSGDLPAKLGSAGLPLNGGSFRIVDSEGAPVATGETGEVVYSGPNVMWGYAQSRDDLARGDDCGGVLHTGDLGKLDEDGYLFLTGRSKRIAKVAGVRVSLDDVESMFAPIAAAAVAAPDDGIIVFAADTDHDTVVRVRRRVAREIGASHRLIDVRAVAQLPLLATGKPDYEELTRMGADG